MATLADLMPDADAVLLLEPEVNRTGFCGGTNI